MWIKQVFSAGVLPVVKKSRDWGDDQNLDHCSKKE
jgi:hypothetical protein